MLHFSPVVSDSTIPARARELTALVAAGELRGRGEETEDKERKGKERRGKRRKGEEKKEEGRWKD